MAKTCYNCGKPLPIGKHKYCSYPCAAAQKRQKQTGDISNKGKDYCATGAISELRVSADLLSKGYDVFRSVSPTSRVDLIIMKDLRCIRIEVRTAHENLITGRLYKSFNKKRDVPGTIDIYAWVLPHRIIYEPELPPQ